MYSPKAFNSLQQQWQLHLRHHFHAAVPAGEAGAAAVWAIQMTRGSCCMVVVAVALLRIQGESDMLDQHSVEHQWGTLS